MAQILIVNKELKHFDVEAYYKRKQRNAIFFVIGTLLVLYLIYNQFKKGNKVIASLLIPLGVIGVQKSFFRNFHIISSGDNRAYLLQVYEPKETRRTSGK